MVMDVVRVALLIKSNLFNCVFAGIFCCNFGSGSGANSFCGGSSLAPRYHHYHYHHHYLSHHHYNKLQHKTNNKIWNSR